MAAPMPPLPPVTRARFVVSLIRSPRRRDGQACVEYDRGAAAEQQRRFRPQFEFVQSGGCVPGHAHSIADQIALYIIEAQSVEPDVAHGSEKSGGRRSGQGRSVVQVGAGCRRAAGDQRTMHGHRLRCVFYAARDAEPSAGSKWIVRLAMSVAAAADAYGTPGNDFIEQAHAPVMRNAAFDPRAVQTHGATFTTMLLTPRSRYSSTVRPASARARCDSSGRLRAAGIESRKVSSIESAM